MTVAAAAKDWRLAGSSRTVRQFGWAVFIAFLFLALAVAIYVIEKYIFQPDRRFIENPGSVMMRAGGLAHFIMGWIFLFTSPRIRHHRSFLQILGLMLVGGVLCFFSSQLGGLANPFLYLFFFCYFLIHEIRDERTIYQCYDVAADKKDSRFSTALMHFAAVSLSGVVCIGYLLFSAFLRPHPQLSECSPWIYGLLGLAFVGILCWTAHRLAVSANREFGSLAAALAEHRPLITVYGGLLAVILLGVVLGGISFNLLIFIHGGSWIAFAVWKMQQRPTPASNPWQWMRGTPVGFVTLHVAVLLFILVLLALRVHVWERVGFISQLVERKNFPYWSLMHITMAFWKPR